MKKLIFTSVFLLGIVNLYSQQLPVFSHNYLNSLLYNPAVPGTDKDQIFLLTRNQWKEFNGPQINLFTADYSASNKPMSFGGILLNKKTGIYQSTKAKLNYSYHLKLSENSKIFLGLAAGIINHRFDFNDIVAIRTDDPILVSPTEKSLNPDFDAGITFKSKTFKAGLALTQLQGAPETLTPIQQVTAFTSYDFIISSDSSFKLQPLVISRLEAGTPIHYDINLAGNWKEMVWLGLNYKNNSAAGFNVAVMFKNIRLAYSYEMPVNSIKTFIPPANELSIAYILSKNQYKTEPKIKKSVKEEKISQKQIELDMLYDELSEKEEQLRKHEREIYAMIDSLYTYANTIPSQTNQEELEKLAKTQKEVLKVKEELKVYMNEKNIELSKLKRRIEDVQVELNELRK